MTLADQNGTTIFSADLNACTAVTFATVQHGQVIDAAGNWHGQPIGGSQTPWASNIAGAGFSLTNVGALQVNGATTTGSLSVVSSFSAGSFSTTGSVTGGSFYVGGTQVINTSAQFVQAVNTTQGIICGSLSTSGGELDCGNLVVASGKSLLNGSVTCIQNGIWIGNGVQCNSDVFGSLFGINGVATGVSGSFTSADGKTVTVTGGIVTGIH